MTLFWQLGTLKFQIESLIPVPEQRHLKFENVFCITFIEINDRSDDHSTTNSVNHEARFSIFSRTNGLNKRNLLCSQSLQHRCAAVFVAHEKAHYFC
jgi:hypothetical protein